VVAADIRKARVGLIRSNAPGLPLVTADAVRSPFRPAAFDRVLVDAPCSGLGTLRRRPDARWRVDAEAPERLAAVQLALAHAALDLLKPGGVLVYSVCTLTDAEGPDVAKRLAAAHPDLEPLDPPDGPWELAKDCGHRLLPHVSDTDGMYLVRFRRG
jgi:16S rRNA (cytosine967-C5)-methyltransferase